MFCPVVGLVLFLEKWTQDSAGELQEVNCFLEIECLTRILLWVNKTTKPERQRTAAQLQFGGWRRVTNWTKETLKASLAPIGLESLRLQTTDEGVPWRTIATIVHTGMSKEPRTATPTHSWIGPTWTQLASSALAEFAEIQGKTEIWYYSWLADKWNCPWNRRSLWLWRGQNPQGCIVMGFLWYTSMIKLVLDDIHHSIFAKFILPDTIDPINKISILSVF